MQDLPNNSIESSGSDGKQAASAIGRNAKNAATTLGKNAKKITRFLSKVLSKIGSFIAAHLPILVSIILVVAMIFGLLAVIAKIWSEQRRIVSGLTPEGQTIMSMFESYCNETYQAWRESDDRDRLHGVSRDSNKRADTTIDNPDDERSKYARVLTFVKDNHYEFMLCGIWKVLAKELMAGKRYEEYRSGGKDGLYGGYNWKNSEDAYKMFITFYCNTEKDNQNKDIDRVGFISELEPDEYPDCYFHQFYCNEMFKACLETFITVQENNVISMKKLNELLKKDGSKGDKDKTPSFTTSNTDDSNFLSDFTIEEYADKLIDETFSNLKRGITSRAAKVNPEGDYEYSGLKITIADFIYSYYVIVDNRLPDGQKIDDAFKNECLKDVKEKIANTAVGFVEYSGTGSTDNLVRLARAQVGSGGGKYCNELNNGVLVDWCAIYAGWLLKNGGGINLEQYGWSPGVGSWRDGLKRVDRFRESGYTPKVGDIVFFDGFSHVGIVIEVQTSYIITSEGNTAGGAGGADFCKRSKVSEYKHSLDSASICGYGMVTFMLDTDMNNVGAREGALLKVQGSKATDDPNYKCMKYIQWSGGKKLTAKERRILEETVSGEFGNDYTGSVMIAQCLRDALVYGYCDSVSNLPSKMSYDGYYAWNGREPTKIAKDAVKYIFDSGGMGVQHRILVMYNPDICTSSWHESQNYIVSVGSVKFFDYW